MCGQFQRFIREYPLFQPDEGQRREDRKSTRLNSSHTVISYAVFCLKKKNPFTPQLAGLSPAALMKRLTPRIGLHERVTEQDLRFGDGPRGEPSLLLRLRVDWRCPVS